MTNFIKQKTEQIKKVHNILKNGKMSEDNYRSTEQPFFTCSKSQNFEIGHNTNPELPDRLNRNFKTFYELPDKDLLLKAIEKKDIDYLRNKNSY